MLVPDRANVRWSMDFVLDQLANGRRFRIFNLVDDFTRECILKFSISRFLVIDWLENLTS